MNLLSTLLLFEDISGGELLLVLLVAFLFFGPKKLPDIARGMAKGLHDLKKAASGITDEINKNVEPLKKELNDHANSISDAISNGINSEESKINNEKNSLKEDNSSINKYSG